jgi:hypothetical membrane protein
VTSANRHRGLEILAAWAGVAAFVVIGLACAWPAFLYRGIVGEPYSPLNHWISELGQLGVSSAAGPFNLGLMLGGAAFSLFGAGLATTSPSRLRWVFGPVGVAAGIGGAFVGAYPMNAGDLHVIAASVFFNLGWIFVALASTAFVRHREPRHPVALAGGGAISVAAFLAFLVSLRVDEFARRRMASSGPISDRPDVWSAPVLEWASLLSIMAWVLLTSLAWLQALQREPGGSTA